MSGEALAFFDFDNTLTTQDSVVPFLLYARKRGLCGWGHLLHAAWFFLRQKVDPKQTVRAKEVSLSFIKGRTQAEMDAFARDFFRDVMSKKFLPEGVRELERLRGEGRRIVIVSASADCYMRVLPEFLPVDAVLATVCLKDDTGRYTGVIEANCRGEAKPVRINAWLAEQGITLDAAASCAWGDSHGDSYMMKMVGSAVLVDPSKALRRAMPDARIVHWH